MKIIITNWALQSYLELLGTFTKTEYKEIIRPDTERLETYPENPKFNSDKFWSPCKDRAKKVIRHGYKMKWHNLGSGRVQLRLLVVLLDNTAYLCNAYVKDSDKKDEREMAKLKNKIKLIQDGRYISRGWLL